jgi:hypothetical protein
MSINLAHFSDVGDVEMVFDKGGESEVGQNKAVQWSGGGSAYFIISFRRPNHPLMRRCVQGEFRTWRYFLGAHGRYAEVSRIVFQYSR